MSTPMPSPSMNGMIGLSGTCCPGPIFAPPSGTRIRVVVLIAQGTLPTRHSESRGHRAPTQHPEDPVVAYLQEAACRGAAADGDDPAFATWDESCQLGCREGEPTADREPGHV